MFEKKLMIAGLVRQRDLLSGLIHHLDSREVFERADCEFYAAASRRVEKNLRRLRGLRRNCFECHE